MSNNNNMKKMYMNNSLVGVVSITQEGAAPPANIESWEYDSWGKPTNIVLKDGVTSIPTSWQNYNYSLSSVTVPSSVTIVYSYSFANCGSSSRPLDISKIYTATANYQGNNFNNSYIYGDFYIKLSETTSATTSSYGSTFEGSLPSGNTVITVDGDGEIIPYRLARFGVNYTSVYNDGGDVIINGQPTKLGNSCLGRGGSNRKIYFTSASAVTAVSTSSSNHPFYSFGGTIYVPSDKLSGWKDMYTGQTSNFKSLVWTTVPSGSTIPSGRIFGIRYSGGTVGSYGSDFSIGNSDTYITLSPNTSIAGDLNIHYEGNDYLLVDGLRTLGRYVLGDFHSTVRQPSFVTEDGTKTAPYDIEVFMPES